MSLTEQQRQWYYKRIQEADPHHAVVTVDERNQMVIYSPALPMDESRHKEATPEEVVHALAICLLVKPPYNYPAKCVYHEKYCRHGRSSKDEVDLVIYDGEGLPFAMRELKSAAEFGKNHDKQIESQLFGTAPLVGAPKLLVFATIQPRGTTAQFTLICVDRTKCAS